MRKIVRRIATVVLSSAFLCGTILLLVQLRGYKQAGKNSDMAKTIALSETMIPQSTQQETAQRTTETQAVTEPEAETKPAFPELPMDEPALTLQQVELAALQEINTEVLGWIYIPDTAISYPLMQTDDQNKYLNHAWDGTPNGSGSIFLEKRNARDMTDFNTIIYGHHMANGTMFQPLIGYRNAEFLESHPYVYILAGDRIFRYRIFSAYEAPVTSHTYRLVFRDDAEKLAAIEHYLQGRTDVELTPQDYILTLSTCTGLGDYSVRWVVQGVLDASWEK